MTTHTVDARGQVLTTGSACYVMERRGYVRYIHGSWIGVVLHGERSTDEYPVSMVLAA